MDIAPRATTPDGFAVYCAHDVIVPAGDLQPNPRNPNKHPSAQIELLAKIITAQGWRAPITVSRRSGLIVRGHARRLAAAQAGCAYAPVDYQDYGSDEAELADLIADNRIAELAVLDENAIAALVTQLSEEADGIYAEYAGYTPEQINAMASDAADEATQDQAAARMTLQERFIIPPFSVLDARGGPWVTRKAAWKQLGIQSEVGRGNDDDRTKAGLTFSRSSQPPSTYKAKNEYEAKIGQKITWEEFADLFPDAFAQGGTSIFDPVLCELAYRWFCPPGGSIIDPFAGGGVRGIVAAMLGRQYTGVDLSERQIAANNENWRTIDHGDAPQPTWITGDSMNIDTLAPGAYDLLFTCPPYADLEVYSDRTEDLSNKDYPEFIALYREILRKAAAMLKPDRFAVIVVGDIRGPDGHYRNFVSDTIAAFQDAGMYLYNEAILITAYGSLAIRVGKQFEHSRKLGKTHQNVLVFCNGDPMAAAQAIGPVGAEDAIEIDRLLKDE